jgi:hypothetical protein
MKKQTTGSAELGNWYAVAAVAVASLGMGGITEAEAAQVVVHPVGGPITPPTSGSGGSVYFNLLDSTGTQWGVHCCSPGAASVGVSWHKNSNGRAAFVRGNFDFASVLIAGSHDYAAKLGNSQAVGRTQFGAVFSNGDITGLLGSSSNSVTHGLWKPGDDAFVGFNAYDIGPDLESFYGWAEIRIGNNEVPSIVAWGYNDAPSDTAYTPGPEPVAEPSSLLLLAAGATGLAAYRKRRAKRQQPVTG